MAEVENKVTEIEEELLPLIGEDGEVLAEDWKSDECMDEDACSEDDSDPSEGQGAEEDEEVDGDE